MAFVEIKNVKMQGMAIAVPKQVFENKEYDVVPLNQRDAFVEAIGIERHHIAPKDVCTSDLCQVAAEDVMQKVGWAKEDIDVLIFVSQTPDYHMPSTSCVLQSRMELPKTCMTFDISQGCSGYVYGLSVMGSLLSSGTMKKGLLLVGNTQSKNVNYADKSTFPLFGDAGSATAFEYCPEDGDCYQLSFMTDGSEKTIVVPDGGYRNMVNHDSFVEYEFGEGIRRNRLNLQMIGDDVFAFVALNVPKATQTMFEQFAIDTNQIDYYLIHHASKFIIDKLIKKLHIPDGKAPIQLRNYGNSSNASIPLLVCTSIQQQVLNQDLKLYVSGFGVGLSMGVGIINIGHLQCADYLEI